MADLARAEELVGAVERDATFRSEVEAAPTVAAKRQVLDSRGFADVGLDDMRAYVESKGGTLTLQEGGRELSEQELAAVAGGLTDAEQGLIIAGVSVGGVAVGLTAAAAAVA